MGVPSEETSLNSVWLKRENGVRVPELFINIHVVWLGNVVWRDLMPTSVEPSREPAEEGVRESKDNQDSLCVHVQSSTASYLRVAYSADDGVKNGTPAWLACPMLSRGAEGLLDRTAQARIGQMLRHIFSDVAEEPVPDRFVKLLEALQAQEDARE
jgi:hypothetical protein